jgi:hypothetical protein
MKMKKDRRKIGRKRAICTSRGKIITGKRAPGIYYSRRSKLGGHTGRYGIILRRWGGGHSGSTEINWVCPKLKCTVPI